jgi:adhesin/invasin
MTSVLIASGCSDATLATRTRSPGSASLSLVPLFDASVGEAARMYRASGVPFDQIRLVIVRPATDTLADTTVTFGSGQGDTTLAITVRAEPGEVLNDEMDYLAGGNVVASGRSTVTTHPLISANTVAPDTIHISVVDPTRIVTRVTVTAPAGGPFPTNASVSFTAQALNSTGGVVPGVGFVWSVSDASVGSVNSGGAVTPTNKGGSLTVRATAGSLFGEATVSFVQPASVGAVVTVSGGGQSGTVGQALAQPMVVEVRTAAGAVISGQAVTFSASTGGSVGSATVTTGADGRAQTTMTLGSTVGSYTYSASAGGQSAQVTATATAGAAAAIASVSGGGQSTVVTKTAANPLVVKVTDAAGNPKSGVTVAWARTSGTGTVASSSSTTGTDGTTSNSFTAGTTPGTTTITATVAGLPAASFSETAVVGPAVNMTAPAGTSITGQVNVPINITPFILITDALGNPVPGAVVTATLFVGGAAVLSQDLTSDAAGKVTATGFVSPVAGVFDVVVEAKTPATLTGSPIVLTVTITP